MAWGLSNPTMPHVSCGASVAIRWDVTCSMTSTWVEDGRRFPIAEPVTETGRLDVFDWAFFVLVAMVTTAGSWLREAGPFGFGAFSVYCLLYAAFRRTLFTLNWFTAFSAIGFVYVFLSYLEVLPAAWTHYYEPEAIPMQAHYIWTLLAIVCAGRAFFVRAIRTQWMPMLCTVLFLLNLTVSTWLDMEIVPLNILDGGMLVIAFINLNNSKTIMILAFAHLAMATRYRMLAYVGVAFVVTSVFYGFSIQIYAALVMFALLQLRALSTWALAGALIAFGAACALVPVFVGFSYLVDTDPNSAIRAYMWVDALDLFFSTYGVGIGFGRELVSNIYLPMNILSFYSEPELMQGGIHNSFITMFARLGVIGGTAFALAVLKTGWPLARSGPLREPARLAFFMAYVSCWVNVAVESPMSCVGTALLLGYVMAARDLGNQVTPATPTPGIPRHA